MDDNKFDFSDLADIHSQEKGTNSLSRLPDDFYSTAVAYIKSLFLQVEKSRADLQISLGKEAVRTTGEYQRAREVLEAIYNTRERKIVLAALNASRGINYRTDNMTEEEKDLYFNLKVEMENKRDRVIRYDRMLSRPSAIRPESGIDTTTDDFLTPEVHDQEPPVDPPPLKIGTPTENACEPPRKKEADRQRTGSSMATQPEGSCLDGYILVRALVDIGSFACGEGQCVSMKGEDIATLPSEIASVLIQQGMVREMEGLS
ncbi:MAG: hypothetical protein QCI82_09830 [Candidatus Thermoplasmatota archaeon]|nr:hypothetical protein [Candidatus Thermoplasmatota archaeon]